MLCAGGRLGNGQPPPLPCETAEEDVPGRRKNGGEERKLYRSSCSFGTIFRSPFWADRIQICLCMNRDQHGKIIPFRRWALICREKISNPCWRYPGLRRTPEAGGAQFWHREELSAPCACLCRLAGGQAGNRGGRGGLESQPGVPGLQAQHRQHHAGGPEWLFPPTPWAGSGWPC